MLYIELLLYVEKFLNVLHLLFLTKLYHIYALFILNVQKNGREDRGWKTLLF